jgi:hypothetical protein
MSQPFTGKVEFLNSNGKTILAVDPDSSFVQIVYKTPNGFQIMEVTNTSSISLWGDLDHIGARLDGSIATLILGRNGKAGTVFLSDGQPDKDSIVLDGLNANLRLGGNNTAGGDIALFPKDATAEDLKGGFGNAIIQLNGNNGNVVLRKKMQNSIVLDPQLANISLGGPEGAGGTLLLFPEKSPMASVVLDGQGGAISIKNPSLAEIIRLERSSAPVSQRPDGLGLVADNGGRIAVKDWSGNDSVVLDGNLGDVVLSNADCAEDFEMSTLNGADPGTVMVIEEGSRLRPSTEPYDKKVAGVISGAGDCKPGIILDKKPSQKNRLPVALIGKVYCKADADYSPIEVGDLLTTSRTPGHAMKASEPLRAFGAVMGKALLPLSSGRGLIPILVTLQ